MRSVRNELSVLWLAAVVLLLFAIALPAHAQSTSAPALSFQRLSVGAGGDFTSYRPTLLDLTRQEFRAVLPISYNLGTYASLSARWSYGLTSGQKEYSVGFVVHLLARGKAVAL
jgi:hypothetical protein